MDKMNRKTETLRMMWPRWQGGMNPDYVIGQKVMEAIVPESKSAITEKISCPDLHAETETVDEEKALAMQNQQAEGLLEKYNPDRILTIGGDCSISQVPFSWLHQKYGSDFGIIWMDAHPDISTVGTTKHLHEMPVSSLLGLDQEASITREKDPVEADHILYAGLIEKDLLPREQIVHDLKMKIYGPEEHRSHPEKVTEWIREEGLKYVAVHWDLDVLSPYDFYGIYPNEPGMGPDKFWAAVGRMTLKEAGELLLSIQKTADMVGLSIAEYLPWDDIRLNELFRSLNIMK